MRFREYWKRSRLKSRLNHNSSTASLFDDKSLDQGQDFRRRCLRAIDISRGRGLEIGPLNRPLLPKVDGRIFYADHSSTEDLIKKYKGDPAVTETSICKVDYDLRVIPLSKTNASGNYDYVVASHVIEHVPDIISWLQEIETILAIGGRLAVVVPDKRYTFDYFRRESQYWMAEQAIGRQRPTLGTVLDYVSNVVAADAGKLWKDPNAYRELRPIHSVEHCVSMISRHAGGEYIDVHCWVFTPTSFSDFIRSIIARHNLRYEVSMLEETPFGQLEFYVQLRKL